MPEREPTDICGREGLPQLRLKGACRLRVLLVIPVAFLMLFFSAGISAASKVSFSSGQALNDPISASLDLVLRTPTTTWRSPLIEVYRWDVFPHVLVIDTADFQIQDRMFTRLAYFVEKKGYQGRLMTNAQLAGRHGWNAHDYGPDGLAAFFNAASAQAFSLNPEETALEALSLREGILVAAGNEVAAGNGGVIALSRSSSDIERKYLLTHESFHGIFFSSPDYRQFCFDLWDSLPSGERDFYTSFLDGLGYDGGDRFLAVNEFQAYLMQQPLSYARSYFQRFFALFAEQGASTNQLADDLLETAKRLDVYLQRTFEIKAGQTIHPTAQGGQGG